MRAWQSGIVVVVSAGNSGPLPQTVGVPGNMPYVITVGAMTDNYTTNKNDDRLASFSSTGPTFEGFVKPDLVAPGGHAWGFMGTYMKIAVDHPTYMNNGDFFTMSGTSQAAAVVSGVAALVLFNDPSLTPDQVKCRIIASAKPAVNADGTLAYSVLQQGTGLVDAERAVNGTANNCANQGLNINADLAGTQHFMGSVRQQADGTFTGHGSQWLAARTRVISGTAATCGTMATSGHNGYLWANGYIWAKRLPLGRTSYDIPWVGRLSANIGTPRHGEPDVHQLLGEPGVVSQHSIVRADERVAGPVYRPRFISGRSPGGNQFRVTCHLDRLHHRVAGGVHTFHVDGVDPIRIPVTLRAQQHEQIVEDHHVRQLVPAAIAVIPLLVTLTMRAVGCSSRRSTSSALMQHRQQDADRRQRAAATATARLNAGASVSRCQTFGTGGAAMPSPMKNDGCGGWLYATFCHAMARGTADRASA